MSAADAMTSVYNDNSISFRHSTPEVLRHHDALAAGCSRRQEQCNLEHWYAPAMSLECMLLTHSRLV
jgi:hypothetical protein